MKTIFKLPWRDQICVWLTESTKSWYIRLTKKSQKAWAHSKTSLLKFPTHSLGYELGCFLSQHQLDLIPKMEDHDIIHVLFNFPPTVEGECRMQFFLFGNGKRSLYTFLTLAIATLLFPLKTSLFYKAYQKGKACLPMHKWDFSHLLYEPIGLLRQLILKNKTTAINGIF